MNGRPSRQFVARIDSFRALISRHCANHPLPNRDSFVQFHSPRREPQGPPRMPTRNPNNRTHGYPRAPTPPTLKSLLRLPIADCRLPIPYFPTPAIKSDPKGAEARKGAQNRASPNNPAQDQTPAARSNRHFRAQTRSLPKSTSVPPHHHRRHVVRLRLIPHMRPHRRVEPRQQLVRRQMVVQREE